VIGLILITLAAFVYHSVVLEGVAMVAVLTAAVLQLSRGVRKAHQRGIAAPRIAIHLAARFLLGAALVPATLLVTGHGRPLQILGIALFVVIAAMAALLWRRRWSIQ
jgi:hypothetical protein